MITRTQIVENSYRWPDETVPYSMGTLNSPTRHRPDCSGYVSMCLGLAPPGLSTVTLPDVCRVIDESELLPGDLLGRMGPGTSGANGHVQLFIGRRQTGLFIAEQAGGGPGPIHHTIAGVDPEYLCWRFNDVEVEEEEVRGIVAVGPGAGVLAWFHPVLGPVYRNIVSFDYLPMYVAAGWSVNVDGNPWAVRNLSDLGQDFDAALGAYYAALATVHNGQSTVDGVANHTHIPGGVDSA